MLLIARHHESEWNKLGEWTGSRDVHLTEYGFEMSGEMGQLISGIHIDRAFASMQVRSIETLSSMLMALGQYDVPTEHAAALDERDYGDYTGKNKWQMEKILGEGRFEGIRRGWDVPIPHGETLKMVYDRAVPYYLQHIVPALAGGANVLVVSHGNVIRALMKYIEGISDEGIEGVEMLFGAVVLYDVDAAGHSLKKEVRSVASTVNA